MEEKECNEILKKVFSRLENIHERLDFIEKLAAADKGHLDYAKTTELRAAIRKCKLYTFVTRKCFLPLGE